MKEPITGAMNLTYFVILCLYNTHIAPCPPVLLTRYVVAPISTTKFKLILISAGK